MITLHPSISRPTSIQVDLSALKYNLQVFRDKNPGAKIMAVVKANGYGHGIIESSRAFLEGGADYLGVALVEEGIELRSAGVKAPILVFGGIWGEQISKFIEYDLEITASSISKLEAIDKVSAAIGKIAKVQLKVDTGLERIGVHHYNCEDFFRKAISLQNIKIMGVYSHLANGDSEDSGTTLTQLAAFNKCKKIFQDLYKESNNNSSVLFHLANSAAALRYPECTLDMIRPGIGLYGISPFSAEYGTSQLKPALKLISTIVYFKVVKAGSGVSYGHTWHAPFDSRVVTIPIGYGDGYSRALSNNAEVIIRGKRYPVIGNICMDQLMVSLGKEGEGYSGDEVILIGSDGVNQIKVTDLAKTAGTIPYEILTNLNLRIPRTYYSGKTTEV